MRSTLARTAINFALVLTIGAVSGRAAEIYWTTFYGDGEGGIMRADLDTFLVEPVIPSGLTRPFRIALDQVGGKMYWTSWGDEQVRRANLDGSDIEVIATTDSPHSAGITVDGIGGKVYWGVGSSVWWADLDGSNAEPLFHMSQWAMDLTLDAAAGKFYVSDFMGGHGLGALRRANLDGTDLEAVIWPVEDGPYGAGVDHTGGKVYWACLGEDYPPFAKLQRANLDGSDMEDIVTDVHANSLALDLTAGKVYWSQLDLYPRRWSIQRANLDGSGVEMLPFGDFHPGGIAFIPEPAAVVILIAGAFVALNRRR